MMLFDDRLATVLRQRADSKAGARTQFRQLLDIMGNGNFGSDKSLIAAAWMRMDRLAEYISANDRAAIIREEGWRFRNAELAEYLANCEPDVASCSLNRADLNAQQWTLLIPRLPVRARGFLRLRKDLPIDVEKLLQQLGVHDQGLPKPDQTEASEFYDLVEPVEAEPETAHTEKESQDADGLQNDTFEERSPEPLLSEGPSSEIAALVDRIARFKRNRDEVQAENDSDPLLPLEGLYTATPSLTSFGFTSDSTGRIDWAETLAAPMIIGKKLMPPRVLGQSRAVSPLGKAFKGRQPIERAVIELIGAEAIAGEWIVDARPKFDKAGHFSGYQGRFRRPASFHPALSPVSQEADRIRQLLHELRTPVTAVQGYAEVIQQQLFGPAPHEYRALAASIAADAAHILAGLEELDRLARLEAGVSTLLAGTTELNRLVAATCAQLETAIASRMAGIEFTCANDAAVNVAIDQGEAESLIWRLLATMASACSAGEHIECSLTAQSNMARLVCELPAQLLAEEDVFAAEVKAGTTAINSGLFGAGFTLRLARAEARGANGNLMVDGDHLILTLPTLVETAEEEENSAQG